LVSNIASSKEVEPGLGDLETADEDSWREEVEEDMLGVEAAEV